MSLKGMGVKTFAASGTENEQEEKLMYCRALGGSLSLYTMHVAQKSRIRRNTQNPSRVLVLWSNKRSVAPLERKKEKPGRVKDKVPVPGLYPDG